MLEPSALAWSIAPMYGVTLQVLSSLIGWSRRLFALLPRHLLLLRCLLFPVAGMLPHSLYFTNIILVTVQESWLAVCPHHWHALAQRDSLNRLIVMQLSCLIAGLNATHGLSFLLHLYCGITSLSRCFLPNMISKNSNVILIDILCNSIFFVGWGSLSGCMAPVGLDLLCIKKINIYIYI